MVSLVDRPHHEPVAREVDLANPAGLLSEPPIAGEGQPQRIQQHDAIDTVVPDQNDRIARMPADHITQRRHRSDEHVLQSLPTGNRRPVRGAM